MGRGWLPNSGQFGVTNGRPEPFGCHGRWVTRRVRQRPNTRSRPHRPEWAADAGALRHLRPPRAGCLVIVDAVFALGVNRGAETHVRV
jgi:hypothetical protein